jgi:hypothetical protein
LQPSIGARIDDLTVHVDGEQVRPVGDYGAVFGRGSLRKARSGPQLHIIARLDGVSCCLYRPPAVPRVRDLPIASHVIDQSVVGLHVQPRVEDVPSVVLEVRIWKREESMKEQHVTVRRFGIDASPRVSTGRLNRKEEPCAVLDGSIGGALAHCVAKDLPIIGIDAAPSE